MPFYLQFFLRETVREDIEAPDMQEVSFRFYWAALLVPHSHILKQIKMVRGKGCIPSPLKKGYAKRLGLYIVYIYIHLEPLKKAKMKS